LVRGHVPAAGVAGRCRSAGPSGGTAARASDARTTRWRPWVRRAVVLVLGVLAPGIALVGLQGAERRLWVVAGLSGAVSAVLLVRLLLVLRGERLAAAVGRSAGRVVQRFRPVTDPGQWAATLARISTSSAETLHSGLWRAVAALVAMVVADGLLLLLALRF